MAFGYMMFLFMILFTVCCSSVWTRDDVGVCIWFKFKKENLILRNLRNFTHWENPFFFPRWFEMMRLSLDLHQTPFFTLTFFLLHIKHGDKQTCWETLAVTRPRWDYMRPNHNCCRPGCQEQRDVMLFSFHFLQQPPRCDYSRPESKDNTDPNIKW